MTRDDEIRRAFHELGRLAGDAAQPAARVATVPRPRGGETAAPPRRRPQVLAAAGLVTALVAAVFVVAAPRSGEAPSVLVTSGPPAGRPSTSASAPPTAASPTTASPTTASPTTASPTATTPVPGPPWQQEVSSRVTSSTLPGSAMMTIRATVSGRTLSVWFWATGTGTGRPEPSCLQVETPAGKTVRVRLARVQLDVDASQNYQGTMTFERVPNGVVGLVYRCEAGYGAARLGVLG